MEMKIKLKVYGLYLKFCDIIFFTNFLKTTGGVCVCVGGGGL